jgi:voltage-gated potassium channel
MVPILAILYGNIRRHHALALLGGAAIAVLAGGVAFALTDDVSVGTGIYWAIVTAATVGYGDISPHNTASRIVAAVVILTAIPLLAAVFALAAGLAAAVHIRRLLGMEHVTPAGEFTVVYGMSPAVPHIVDELVSSGRHVVLVADAGATEVDRRVQLLSGDPTNEVVLRRSHPEKASNALVAHPDDGDVLVTCVALRTLAPDLEVTALVRSPKVGQALRELGISRTLSSDELVAHTLAKTLEAPHAGELLLRLIDSNRFRMEERPVPEEMIGTAPGDVRFDSPAIVLGVLRDGEVSPSLSDSPGLSRGDILITLATRTS